MSKCVKSSKKNDYRPKGFAAAMAKDSNMGMAPKRSKKPTSKKA